MTINTLLRLMDLIYRYDYINAVLLNFRRSLEVERVDAASCSCGPVLDTREGLPVSASTRVDLRLFASAASLQELINTMAHNANTRHTVVINNRVYTEAPRGVAKRPIGNPQGGREKIHKTIHLSPDLRYMLQTQKVLQARVDGRHNGNHVYLYIRQGQDIIHNVDVREAPRVEDRIMPIRTPGH